MPHRPMQYEDPKQHHGPTPQRENGGRAAIRSRVDDLVTAIGAKDLRRLGEMYSPDVVSFDIEPPLVRRGVDEKLSNWRRVFTAFGVVSYDVRDVTCVVGDVVAFAYLFGRLGGTLVDGTAVPGRWVRVTLCFRQTSGTWRITHDHVSLPMDVALSADTH